MPDLLTVPFAETLIYAPAAFGMFLAFRVLRFPDLSVDNTFALGGLAGAAAIVSGLPESLALLVALSVGVAVGAFTSSLFSFARLPKLLAGVITYSILFGVNLRIFNRPNVSLPDGAATHWLLSPAIALIALTFLASALRSTVGRTLIAHGDNERLTQEFGFNERAVLALGLGSASGLIALSGFVVARDFGFADVGLGLGTLLHGVAAILIAGAIAPRASLPSAIVVVPLGLYLYNGLAYFAVSRLSGLLRAPDIKLFSSALVVVAMIALRSDRRDALGL